MKKLTLALLPVLLYGCAATYEPPRTAAPHISANVQADRATILRAAKRALVADGYQITNTDDAGGVISTAALDARLSPGQADCGTTMGIDYLKDNRTSTRVSYGVIADDGSISVKAAVQGNYGQGDVYQNITLQCVSRGELEQAMINKIIALLPSGSASSR